MLPFVRSDLARLVAYTPHPGGAAGHPDAVATEQVTIDRLDTNENPYDLPDDLKQKLAWTYQQAIEANRYPDGSHAQLKAAIAQYVNESAGLSGSLITPDQISVGNGSDELIRSLLIATCLGGEGAVLVAEPTFSMYKILAQTLGIPVVMVGRSDSSFEMDLIAAQTAIATSDQPAVRVVFVVHPNSPTGNALTTAELAWLQSLPEHILVVIDEAYFEFSQASLVGELSQRSNWVILRTFSKAFRLASHRVGYAIAHPELAAALEKVRLPYNLPSTTQAAAQLVLIHHRELMAVVTALQAERQQLWQALAAHPALQVHPSSANFIFVRLKPFVVEALSGSADAVLDQVFQQLKRQGSLVRKINGGLRITVGSPAENQRTLDRLQQSLASLAVGH
jgi:histidinol-phosphate aminotransferase